MILRPIPWHLSRLRRRERWLAVAWGLARWLALSVGVLSLSCLADWLIDLRLDTPWHVRVGMMGGQAALGIASIAAMVVAPALRRIDDDTLALRVEERAPGFNHRLISVLQLNRAGARTDGMSRELISVLTAEVERQASWIDFACLVNHRRLVRSARLAASVAVGVAGLIAIWPETVEALVMRQLMADREIPRTLTIVSQGPSASPTGEPVALRFRVRGSGLGRRLRGRVRVEPAGQPVEQYLLDFESEVGPGEGTYVARVPAASASFRYEARLRDGRSHPRSSLICEPRPATTRIRASILLPDYCGSRSDGRRYERDRPRGDVSGPPGSSARIVAEVQKPVIRASIELLAKTRVIRRVAMGLSEGGRRADGRFELSPDVDGYRIHLEDSLGFTDANSPRRRVAVVPDDPPRVSLLPERLAGGEGAGSDTSDDLVGLPIPLGGEFRVAYTCSDAFDLDRAEFRYRVNEGTWKSRPLAEVAASPASGPFDPLRGTFRDSGSADQIGFHPVPSLDPATELGRSMGGGRFDVSSSDLAELRVGDQIEFCVVVFDRNPAPDRAPGRSEVRRKEIVTPSKFVDWVFENLEQGRRARDMEPKPPGEPDAERAEQQARQVAAMLRSLANQKLDPASRARLLEKAAEPFARPGPQADAQRPSGPKHTDRPPDGETPGPGDGPNPVVARKARDGVFPLADVEGKGTFLDLPPRERELARQALRAKLPPDFAPLIRQYYINIARGRTSP